MGDYPYTPPAPPPQSSPPPVGDDCNAGTIGLNLQTLLDIEASNPMGGGLLPNAQLLRLDLGETSVAIGNPQAPECSDQQTGALIDVDASELPVDILGETGSTADLLHLTLDSTARVGNPFASESGGEDTVPLIDINTQSLPFDVFGGSGSDDGGSLLAGLLGSGPDAVGTATGMLSGLLGSEDSGGGSDDCGCSGSLQPVLDLVLNPVDGLFA